MEQPTWPTASVIVVGCDSSRYLRCCLGALLGQDYPGTYEVIFVDNASSDGSAALVRRLFPSVRVLERTANDGYAGGSNSGASAASGEVLAFVNPDTVADGSWLWELVRPLLADPTIGLTTSRITLLDRPDLVNTCGNAVSLAGVTTCRRAGQPAAAVRRDETVAAVSGAAFATRAGLFRRLGGFDEAFFMYLEDTDLSLRARMAGYSCVMAAASVVAHDYELALPPEKLGRLERNRYRMLVKNFSLPTLALLAPQLALAEVAGVAWAASRGRRHLRAKLATLAWLVSNFRGLRAERAAAMPLQRASERAVLRQHAIAPPVRAVTSGLSGRFAQAVLAPVALVAALPLLLLFQLKPAPATFGSVGIDDPEVALGPASAGG
jgi:GT2 family glycosyltransferase